MENQEVKVLHIMSGFGGGISSFIRNKARLIQNENIVFDLATYDECDDHFKEAIWNTGGKIYKLINPKVNGWKSFKKSYTNILETNNYDIIYCHINGYRVLPYYYYARKHSKAKFYIHAHLNKPLKYLTKMEQYELKTDQIVNRKVSDHIVGCGELAIESVFGSNISRNEMMIIPNSVEVERFIKDKATAEKLRIKHRTHLKIEDNQLVIGHVGRLEKIKNHDLTIKLAKYIKNHNLQMSILIIGEGNREKELKDLVDKEQLNDVLMFTGRISPIEEFLPALDVMLLPSISEGLPTTVIETQAAGVPVVMSNTITPEVDLGLGMIKTVSLEDDITTWVDAICESQNIIVPESILREHIIKEKKFSNETSADLYINFLKGNINNYTIL